MELAHWNPDGFKTGLCAAQPIGQPHSLLALSNNCCMAARSKCAIARSSPRGHPPLHEPADSLRATGWTREESPCTLSAKERVAPV